MSSHAHPPGTMPPDGREEFLVDGCPRCAEYATDLGLHFDADRFRAFWKKMIEVEYFDAGGYASALDKQLGRRLYFVSLAVQRAFGLDLRRLHSSSVWVVVTDPAYDDYGLDIYASRAAAIAAIKASVGESVGDWSETHDGARIEFQELTPIRRLSRGAKRVWNVDEAEMHL